MKMPKGALSSMGRELFLALKQNSSTAVLTGRDIFPLPLVPCDLSQADQENEKTIWLNCLTASLDWLSGFGMFLPPKGEMNALLKDLVGTLESSLILFDRFRLAIFGNESMNAFWNSKVIIAYGEECH